MIRYAWFKSGYIDANSGQFQTAVDVCFKFHQGHCDTEGYDSFSFIRCSYCDEILCFDHFFINFHSHWCLEVQTRTFRCMVLDFTAISFYLRIWKCTFLKKEKCQGRKSWFSDFKDCQWLSMIAVDCLISVHEEAKNSNDLRIHVLLSALRTVAIMNFVKTNSNKKKMVFPRSWFLMIVNDYPWLWKIANDFLQIFYSHSINSDDSWNNLKLSLWNTMTIILL